jgi:hypothetical protein
MENELLKLAGIDSPGGIESVSKFDTNPANSPQPPKR